MVNGSIGIDSNAKLESLAGLENVTHVGDSLGILQNSTLQTLSPLDAWPSDAIEGSLAIISNMSLKNCEATALAAHFGAACTCTNNAAGSCL